MQKGARTRGAILKEAADLASVVGLDGISIGILASHTGLSKSGLFAHFGSKETLQVETLRAAADRFTDLVVRPALKLPRGIPRLRGLFDNWLDWSARTGLPGGCVFIAAAIELDDQEGPARDFVAAKWTEWYALIARTAEMAVEVGALRPELDCAQFSHDTNAIFFGFQHAKRLLRDPRAEARARAAFDRLLEDAQ